MNCQEIQQLLAFVDRQSEQLDAAERAMVQQHLDNCTVCAEQHQAESRADVALGTLMRDVAVPDGLKRKVLDRLTTDRGGFPWKSSLAIAAAVLIAVAGGYAWYSQAHPVVNKADFFPMALQDGMEPGDVEHYLAERGITVKVPRQPFAYRHLRHVCVDEFKGQRIAKLTFSRLEDGKSALATVLILSPEQFRTDNLKDNDGEPGSTSILIHREQGFVYVILLRGNMDVLHPDQQ